MSDLDPEFLELEDVFELHADSIARYGGDLGVRDRGLIESAVAVPRQSFGGEYLHTTLFEMAAAYAFGSRVVQPRSPNRLESAVRPEPKDHAKKTRIGLLYHIGVKRRTIVRPGVAEATAADGSPGRTNPYAARVETASRAAIASRGGARQMVRCSSTRPRHKILSFQFGSPGTSRF